MKTFNELRKINVNELIERKGSLSYLSWTHAVDILLQNDPTATWTFNDPKAYGQTIMVCCSVTAFGKTMVMQLPVMDNRNNAIVNPDARKVSDAQMRCLAKCIACFGIGLYIYAGEDLPSEDNPHAAKNNQPTPDDGYPYQGPYRFKTGSFKHRTPEEVPIKDLKKWVLYWDDRKEKGGNVTGLLAEDLERAAEFIVYFENNTIEQEQADRDELKNH